MREQTQLANYLLSEGMEMLNERDRPKLYTIFRPSDVAFNIIFMPTAGKNVLATFAKTKSFDPKASPFANIAAGLKFAIADLGGEDTAVKLANKEKATQGIYVYKVAFSVKTEAQFEEIGEYLSRVSEKKDFWSSNPSVTVKPNSSEDADDEIEKD